MAQQSGQFRRHGVKQSWSPRLASDMHALVGGAVEANRRARAAFGPTGMGIPTAPGSGVVSRRQTRTEYVSRYCTGSSDRASLETTIPHVTRMHRGVSVDVGERPRVVMTGLHIDVRAHTLHTFPLGTDPDTHEGHNSTYGIYGTARRTRLPTLGLVTRFSKSSFRCSQESSRAVRRLTTNSGN